jgi:hypothetical protein
MGRIAVAALLLLGCADQGQGMGSVDMAPAPGPCQKPYSRPCPARPSGVACLDDLLAGCLPTGECVRTPTLLVNEKDFVDAYCFDNEVSEEIAETPTLVKGSLFHADGTVCFGFVYEKTMAGEVTVTYTDGGSADQAHCFSTSKDISVLSTGGAGATVAVERRLPDGTSTVECAGQPAVTIGGAAGDALAFLPIECGGTSYCQDLCHVPTGGGGG